METGRGQTADTNQDRSRFTIVIPVTFSCPFPQVCFSVSTFVRPLRLFKFDYFQENWCAIEAAGKAASLPVSVLNPSLYRDDPIVRLLLKFLTDIISQTQILTRLWPCPNFLRGGSTSEVPLPDIIARKDTSLERIRDKTLIDA